MRVTILCPGPSLRLYRPGCEGMTIGVNRAATVHACDVWAATDWPLIRETRPLGTPTLLTIEATRESLSRRGRPWPYLVVTHCGLVNETVTNAKHPWTRYTATAALFYAGWLGADRIDVYGCDWSGTKDWDGEDAGENRSDNRWAEERDIWNKTAASLRCEVIRHGPA